MAKNSTGKEKPLDPIQAETAAAIVVLARRLKTRYATDKDAEQLENHALALLRGQKPVPATSTGAES